MFRPNLFLVTGTEHTAEVYCINEQEAVKEFKLLHRGEDVLSVQQKPLGEGLIPLNNFA